eukprot:TRINITY_DN27780_c0_g1_i1.p2 TRINITY_DN27780_c0_g1~~TRINITY_DN27780_c0_g1_i1.p2  ORF type:complete len:109 (+),score=14.43 TRINITY_DN27780_c0_g1_i1:52-378(+)
MDSWAGKNKNVAVSKHNVAAASNSFGDAVNAAPWRRSSKSAGKGLGKKGKSGAPWSSKRPRYENRRDEFQRLKHLSVTSAKLGLKLLAWLGCSMHRQSLPILFPLAAW